MLSNGFEYEWERIVLCIKPGLGLGYGAKATSRLKRDPPQGTAKTAKNDPDLRGQELGIENLE